MANLAATSGIRPCRWLRFSLRSLLFFITLVCVILGIWLERARRQHEIVKAIRDAGGYVEYEVMDQKANQPQPPFWHSLPYGRDLFDCVDSVTIHDRCLLAKVARLHRVRDLSVFDDRLTDTDLTEIENLRGLKALRLVGNQSDLVPLVIPPWNHPEHSPLNGYSQLTARSLEHICRLGALEELTLSGKAFSAGGIARLAEIKTLRELDIDWYNSQAPSPEKSWLDPLQSLRAIERVTLLGPNRSVWLASERPWRVMDGEGIYEVDNPDPAWTQYLSDPDRRQFVDELADGFVRDVPRHLPGSEQ